MAISLKYSVKHCVDQLNKLRPSLVVIRMEYSGILLKLQTEKMFLGEVGWCWKKMETSWANERMHHT